MWPMWSMWPRGPMSTKGSAIPKAEEPAAATLRRAAPTWKPRGCGRCWCRGRSRYPGRSWGHGRHRRHPASGSFMVPTGSLHLPPVLLPLPPLCLAPLPPLPPRSLARSPLGFLDFLPRVRQGLELSLESLSVEVGIDRSSLGGLELRLELLHVTLAAHLVRLGSPVLKTRRIERQLRILDIVVVGERPNGRLGARRRAGRRRRLGAC